MRVVEAERVAKTYASPAGDVEALRGVTLRVEEGEFVAVMGPSGSGKSTLLHVLGGLERPTDGQVSVAGRSLAGLGERQLALVRRQAVGFVFQSFNLVSTLSVGDNVELPALLAGASARVARERREALLAALGLAERASASPSALSGGEQQRVAVARALVNRPAVVLADEPTGSLDSDATASVVQLLRATNGDGQTLILVTHDPRVAANADRIVQMRDGTVVDEIRVGPEPTPTLDSLLYGQAG